MPSSKWRPILILVGTVLLVSSSRPAHAQSLSSEGLRVRDSAVLLRVVALRPTVSAGVLSVLATDTVATRGPNYWVEGAAIGAVTLGLPVLMLGMALCEGDGCGGSVALTSLGAAAAGAFIGGMIGGAIDKQPKENGPPGSP
jgi:hypothetical protein